MLVGLVGLKSCFQRFVFFDHRLPILIRNFRNIHPFHRFFEHWKNLVGYFRIMNKSCLKSGVDLAPWVFVGQGIPLALLGKADVTYWVYFCFHGNLSARFPPWVIG